MALVMLAACSDGPSASTSNETAASPPIDGAQASPSVIETKAGRYRVEIDPKLDTATLPTNADLKMVDGDIAQYAVKLCQLDFANKLSAQRCEVFVQPDKAGLLTGYATVQQGADVSIETAVETDRQRTGLGCIVSGKLENTDYDKPNAKLDISRDFESRLPFLAWEKSPGDWMVSSNDEEGGENGAFGMWYVKRENNKLRVTQERWNYCYKDSKTYIDEVFRHAVTLTRETAG